MPTTTQIRSRDLLDAPLRMREAVRSNYITSFCQLTPQNDAFNFGRTYRKVCTEAFVSHVRIKSKRCTWTFLTYLQHKISYVVGAIYSGYWLAPTALQHEIVVDAGP